MQILPETDDDKNNGSNEVILANNVAYVLSESQQDGIDEEYDYIHV